MIQVLHRCLDLLEWMADEPRTPRLMNEMAQRLEISTASCSHLAKTLVQRGYLEKLAGRRGYILGPMAVRLGQARGQYGLLVQEGEAAVSALAQQTGETTLLATLQGARRILLCLAEGTQTVRVASSAWVQDDIYQTATGRVLLAHQPDDVRQEIINTLGLPGAAWEGVTSVKKLEAALAEIRADGSLMRVTDGDVVQIAVPVVCHNDVLAALGTFIPSYRATASHKKTVLAALRATAQSLQERLA